MCALSVCLQPQSGELNVNHHVTVLVDNSKLDDERLTAWVGQSIVGVTVPAVVIVNREGSELDWL